MAKARSLDAEALLGAIQDANAAVAVAAVAIPTLRVRGEAVEFDVRALTLEELLSCRQRATKNGTTDEVALVGLMIVTATVPEDRAALWQSEALQQQYGAASPVQLATKLLSGGDGLAAVTAINALSGGVRELEDSLKSLD